MKLVAASNTLKGKNPHYKNANMFIYIYIYIYTHNMFVCICLYVYVCAIQIHISLLNEKIMHYNCVLLLKVVVCCRQ